MSRPFRFGTMSMPFTPFAQLVEQAKVAEDAGFDLFLLPDFSVAVSPIATLAALAGYTSTLRFSPLVVNAGLWRPDLLVREFLSADQISGGRVEIGLGAGNAPGGPPKPLTHLRDVVQALRASLDNPANPPGWVSRPPIVIAGSGDNLLRAGGELADIVGFAGPATRPSMLAPNKIPLLSPAATADRIAAVRAGAGDRFDRIELNVGAEVHICADRRAAAEQAHQVHSYLSVEEILASPKFLAGTVEEIAEQLAGHRERYGLSYFVVIGITAAEFAPVIAALR
jgi:alkanesulfonate monooxygenase SsuD/methylene tetrahydromethanopterin reductase-like flavin-dependent oxidoreductase (luciferase family)